MGAGTGIFTRCLLAHPQLGLAVDRLIAVEPSPGMRSKFEETIHDSRVSCKDGTFENTGVEGSTVDLIVVAQVDQLEAFKYPR